MESLVPAWMQIFSSTNYSILCRRSGRRCVCVCFLMGEMKRVLVFCSTQTYFAHGSMRDQCLAFGAKLTNSLLKLIGDRGLKIVMFQKQFLLSAVPKALRCAVTIPLLGLGKACYLADGKMRNCLLFAGLPWQELHMFTMMKVMINTDRQVMCSFDVHEGIRICPNKKFCMETLQKH